MKKFADGGHPRRRARPPIDQSRGIGVARAQPALVIVRQELRLVRGHVHLHRAIVLAAFARQAEVERFADRLVAPAALDHIAADHFVQQPRAAARRVLLFARHHVARAHGALAARAGGRRRRRRSDRSHRESCDDRPENGNACCTWRQVVADAFAQVFIDAVRIDHLARIHLPVRDPRSL